MRPEEVKALLSKATPFDNLVKIPSSCLKMIRPTNIPKYVYVEVICDEDDEPGRIDTDIYLHWNKKNRLIACVNMDWSTTNWTNELSPEEYSNQLRKIIEHRHDLGLKHFEVGKNFISIRYHVLPERKSPRKIWEEALYHIFFTRLTFDKRLSEACSDPCGD